MRERFAQHYVLGKASASGGKGKQQKVEHATKAYLAKANALLQKLEKSKSPFTRHDAADMAIMQELERFMGLLQKHIGLLDRRVL